MLRQICGAMITLCMMAGAAHANPRTVEVGAVERGDFAERIALIGRIESTQEIMFTVRKEGVLTAVYVKDGASVKAGDIIAEMDNQSDKDALHLAERSEKVSHEQYERNLSLTKSGATSKASLDEYKRQWYSARQELLQARKTLEDSIFRAPFDGILGVFQVRQGSYLTTGKHVVSLYNPYDLMVELDIPETVLSSIHVGSSVLVLGQEFTISSVQYLINPITRMADATIILDNLKDQVNIGQQVAVSLLVNEQRDVFLAPKSALFIKDAKLHVFRVKDGKAELVAVQVGTQDDKRAVITEGLQAGDQLILFGQGGLQDGQEVRLPETKPENNNQ